MLGCDFHCSYCQNWITSQALRDPEAGGSVRRVSPQDLVESGRRMGARVVASSYNEPLITSEWARAVFQEAGEAGLTCAYISNGNATREVLEYLRPHVQGFKVDLKSMRDKPYRRLGGVLQKVLDGIRLAHEMGFWVEVVTLVVPGFNDSPEELADAAAFIASVSPDIPWHVTAFHQEYKMTEPGPTTAEQLIRAADIGRGAGLRYVYAGNLPGQVGPWEHTCCPTCEAQLIRRLGFVVLEYRLSAEGKCPECGTAIPGIWHETPTQAPTGTVEDFFFRRPRPVAS
jgi:pyruvate formate lyase activating enzyme